MLSKDLTFSDLPFIPKRIFIGFSGGLDSRVLFDLLYHHADIKAHNIALILVNVNHHTDPSEEALSAFAATVAEDYQVPVHLLHVKTVCPKGESLEAFMRAERYALFESLLDVEDVLVTGHHLDDQAETFLLNLMRGAGMQGLCGMSPIKKQGQAYLWRPLLNYSKKELLAYAEAKKLSWREDPTNKNLALDRIFLRTQVLPLLKQRWPRADEVLARTANNMRSAQDVLALYLHQDLKKFINAEGALSLKPLKDISEQQAVLLLKAYLDRLNYRLGMAQLTQIYQDFVLTDNDARPLFEYQGVRLTRQQQYLYFERS